MTAEYSLLFSREGVEKVKPVGEKVVAGGAEMIQAISPAHYLPAHYAGKLARAAILDCTGAQCVLRLEP